MDVDNGGVGGGTSPGTINGLALISIVLNRVQTGNKQEPHHSALLLLKLVNEREHEREKGTGVKKRAR